LLRMPGLVMVRAVFQGAGFPPLTVRRLVRFSAGDRCWRAAGAGAVVCG